MPHTRAFLATLITSAVLLFSPFNLVVRAADGTDKDTPSTSKADVSKSDPAKTNAKDGTEASTKEGPSSSAFEAELQAMREEMKMQRTALEAQQARIAELESQLRLSAANSAATPASASAPGTAPDATTPLFASGMSSNSAPQSGGTQEKPKKSPLTFTLGPAELTPGGWADLTAIFRSTNIGSGTGTSFNSIPYNNTLPQAALTELRFTAQTSRLSMLANIPVNDETRVTGYVESDFNGFQPPNAYISTNSSTFRLRLFWGDIHHGKWEVLAGQSWSLLTPNRVGLSPMPADIFTSYRLDTNYLSGLTYLRQAGFRAVYHAGDWWTIGASLENAQQYVPSSVVFPGAAGFFSGQFDNGSSATNAVGATSNGSIPNLHPDVVIKTAFDWKVGERRFHLESAGLIRSFKAFNNLVTPSDTTMATGVSGSLNLNFEVLKNFRLIANTFYGQGGGRYIGGLGPDLVVRPDGAISPLHAGSGVGGFEWQMHPRFLIDAYYSGAYFARNFGLLASSATPSPKCDGVP